MSGAGGVSSRRTWALAAGFMVDLAGGAWLGRRWARRPRGLLAGLLGGMVAFALLAPAALAGLAGLGRLPAAGYWLLVLAGALWVVAGVLAAALAAVAARLPCTLQRFSCRRRAP